MKPSKSDVKFLSIMSLFCWIFYICSLSVILTKGVIGLAFISSVLLVITVLLGGLDD